MTSTYYDPDAPKSAEELEELEEYHISGSPISFARPVRAAPSRR